MSDKAPNNQATLHEQLTDPSKSSLQRYQELALGTSSIWYLFKFELIMLFSSWVPGALGLVLRKFLYPLVMGEVGRSVVFGQGVSIRHGNKIRIGDNVVIDDNATLDAKGDSNYGLTIGDNTIISRNVVLSCKNGDLTIGQGCTIGINSLIHAMQGSDVVIGNEVLMGAFCYVIGSGPYITDKLDVSFKKQGVVPQGGVRIADNVWLGSSAQVMDGVMIGTGAIIGSGSIVNKAVDEYCVVAGVPIKVIKSRKG